MTVAILLGIAALLALWIWIDYRAHQREMQKYDAFRHRYDAEFLVMGLLETVEEPER